MSMTFEKNSIDDLVEDFALLDTEGKKAIFKKFREEVEIIKDISVQQTPVDKGDLEAAHHIVEEGEGADRLSLEVEVGGYVNGRDVDEYADVIHEGIAWEKLGPKSLEKQSEVAPRVVGPKFLERAYDEREDPLMAALEELLVELVDEYVGE